MLARCDHNVYPYFVFVTLLLPLTLFVSLSHPYVIARDNIDVVASMNAWVTHVVKTSSPHEIQPPAYNSLEFDALLTPGPAKPQLLGSTATHGRGVATKVGNFSNTTTTVVVAKDGSGHFKTVNAAVNSIPLSNSNRVIIYIKAGIYKEKVAVNQSWITFQGDGPQLTEIQWNDTAAKAGSTFASASVMVNGDHFTAREISFRNTAPIPRGGEVGRQAVALRISGDFAAFFDVNFYSMQDTLYDHQGRHYFYRCYVEGSTDFIFGNGRSFYLESHLHSIANTSGSLTAQNRLNASQATGFSFMMCAVTGSGSNYLGRAWGPASRAVFAFTFMDDIIMPKGWFDWSDSARQKTVFYGEYKCFGRGSDRGGRVPWSLALTPKQANPFLTTSFINGELWLSMT